MADNAKTSPNCFIVKKWDMQSPNHKYEFRRIIDFYHFKWFIV